MTKTRSTKRALLMSGLALLMCVSMLIGSTFAWFTDSVTSAGNKIVAGTLNIDMSVMDENGTYQSVKENSDAIFGYTLWEPGYTEWKNVKVSTTGNLALKYVMNIAIKGERSILADVIDVYYASSEITKPENRSLDGLTRLGTISELLDGTTGALISDTLIPDQNNTEDFATIVLKMQESAGNDYQGKTIGEFDIQILATQLTYESDSFDDQYDKDAEYPEIIPTVSTLAELREAMTKGGEYKLAADINVSSTELLYKADGGHSDGSAFFVKKDTIIDLNGHNIIVNSGNVWADVFFMNFGADLTITGEGDIKADCSIACVYDANSTLNVEGGNFYVTANNDMLYAIYGKINVSGGTFTTSYWNTINIYGSGRVDRVDVSGGSFENWNPASSPDGNLLADGYKVVSEVVDGVTWYNVVPE